MTLKERAALEETTGLTFNDIFATLREELQLNVPYTGFSSPVFSSNQGFGINLQISSSRIQLAHLPPIPINGGEKGYLPPQLNLRVMPRDESPDHTCTWKLLSILQNEGYSTRLFYAGKPDTHNIVVNLV